MKLININLKLKKTNQVISLSPYRKIYATTDGVFNYWWTSVDSRYRLEVVIDENEISVYPLKVTKDMRIITSDEEIANQMTSILLKSRIFQLNKT